jgi:hypothetical protein
MERPRTPGAGIARAWGSLGGENHAHIEIGPSAQRCSPAAPRAVLAAAESISRAIWRMAAEGRPADAITIRAHDLNRSHGSPFDSLDVEGQVEHILASIPDDARVPR